MKKLLIIILTTISFPVCAGEYVQDGFSCISKDSFNEMTKAYIKYMNPIEKLLEIKKESRPRTCAKNARVEILDYYPGRFEKSYIDLFITFFAIIPQYSSNIFFCSGVQRLKNISSPCFGRPAPLRFPPLPDDGLQ
jgi:hypothetical protein